MDFKRPNFLSRDIKIAPLDGEKYGEGLSTIVGNLENLPDAIREQAPDGYVVKQYKFENYNVVPLEKYFEGDTRYARLDGNEFVRDIATAYFEQHHKEPSVEEVVDIIMTTPMYHNKFIERWEMSREDVKEFVVLRTVSRLTREMEDREDTMINFFASALPELVVPSQFIIGNDEETGRSRIYAFQKKINGLISQEDTDSICSELTHSNTPVFERYAPAMDSLAQKQAVKLRSMLTPEQTEKIKREILQLPSLSEKFTEQTENFSVDLFFPSNILITTEGLRIIDTNQIMPAKDSKLMYSENALIGQKLSIYFWEQLGKYL